MVVVTQGKALAYAVGTAKLGACVAKENVIDMEGVVVEALPNATFRVKVESLTGADGKPHMVLATVSGKIRLNFIRILPGDRVKMELSPYDLTRGRIVYRYK